MELLGRFLLWLVPPDTAEGKEVRRWRVTVAVVTMANSAGIIVMGALCFGAVPAIYAGFAPKEGLDAVRESQLDAKLLDTKTRQCAAIARVKLGGDPSAADAKRFATERLQYQLRQYYDLTKQAYRIPECDEL